MAALVDAGIVPAADIVVITPYRSNLVLIKKQLAEHQTLSDVAVYTTDEYHRYEGAAIFFVMVVTEDTGAIFVAHANRICVAITRHVEFLFVVGDIKTVDTGKLDGKKDRAMDRKEDVDGEDGLTVTVKYRIFRNMLKYFKDNKRVFNA